ncbi:MAG: aldo/keto reductase [Alphaproteobacteria bacterium]|jgi:aryl-alcohol dehydrogenase-like predicted oxidoreductase|nr:aldo/keto reductase [Alphaproteobacteria bacterium]
MHPLLAKLGLGVAQFGLDGRSRGAARPPEIEVRDMLALAERSGLSVLDAGAASAHGEAVIGAVMPRPWGLRVTVRAARGDKGPDHVEAEARASLARLGVQKADAIMVQAAGDLFSPFGAEMWTRLLRLRDEGLFDRVGISAYASDDPPGLARRFHPDLIQAPASLLDQRLLVDGSLKAVRDLGVEVHLRAIFLNGPLFRPADRAPAHLKAAAIRLSRARRLIAEGRSDPLQAALGFALSRHEADVVIAGASSAAELSAIIAAASNPPPDLDWDDMALEEPDLFDPTPHRWAAA